jgi:hypothetical protein
VGLSSACLPYKGKPEKQDRGETQRMGGGGYRRTSTLTMRFQFQMVRVVLQGDKGGGVRRGGGAGREKVCDAN